MNSHSEYSILWLFAASPRVCCANLAAGNRLRAAARTLLSDGSDGANGRPVNGSPR